MQRCHEANCDVIYMEKVRANRYPDPPCAVYEHHKNGMLYVQFRPGVEVKTSKVCARCGMKVLLHTEVSVVQALGIAMAYADLVMKSQSKWRRLLVSVVEIVATGFVGAAIYYWMYGRK